MQSLHPFSGSIQEYLQEVSDPARCRLDHCPLCQSRDPLRAHGFYWRTVVDVHYDGSIPVRRYLCVLCKRTVSLLPEFVLPYLRFSIRVIALFLVSRLLSQRTLAKAAEAASQCTMPYQRGQFWIRRFCRQAEALCTALASLTRVLPARDSLTRALEMLEAVGWIAAHRFLFGVVRMHLLGWPRFLIPYGCRFQFLPDVSGS
jgi:transposase-like protein